MNQVHKETLSQVENALPNRQGLDVEIFGMEGIPQDILDQHKHRIAQNFFQAQEDRRMATGNPTPGGDGLPRKKIKYETPEELKRRFNEWREKRNAARASGVDGGAAPNAAANYVSIPACLLSESQADMTQPPQQFPAAQAPYADPQYSQPGFSPQGSQQPFAPQTFPAYSASSLPPRPGASAPTPTGLPQRPTYQGGFWNGSGAPPAGASGEEQAAAAPAPGDDIDQLIRMAEAGIRPKKGEGEEAAAPAPEKKSKKEKQRMVYHDADVSPEERMLQLPKYRFQE